MPLQPPPPDSDDRTARRTRLLANLDEAVQLAKQLNLQVANAFPLAAAEVQAALDLALSVDERVQHGDEAASQLTAIALHLAPEETLDALESTLDRDRDAQRAAASLIARLNTL